MKKLLCMSNRCFVFTFFIITMNSNFLNASQETDHAAIETFNCKRMPKFGLECPHVERPPHKPEETFYYASRNRSVLQTAHSGFKVVDRDIFKVFLFGDFEYEPFVSTKILTGFIDQQIFLYPTPQVYDAQCKDITANANIQLTYLHILLGELFQFPEAFGANPYLDFVVEYYGPTGYDIDIFAAVNQGIVGSGGNALIYAALYMDWEKTSLAFGRTWNPWVDPEIQVSNHRVTTIGCLAEQLNRDYQIRLTQEVSENTDIICAVMGIFDKQLTAGNNGFVNEDNVQFNALQIDFHAQVRTYQCDNIFAAGIDVATEKPLAFNDWLLSFTTIPVPFNSSNAFKNNSRVVSISGFAFGKLDFEEYVVRAKILAGTSITNDLGGFAESSRSMCVDANGCKLPPNVKYTPFKILQSVFDVTVPGMIEPGLFFSCTKNLGTLSRLAKLDPAVYPSQTGDNQFIVFNFEPDLDYTIFISPRIKCHSKTISFCGEVEFSRAAYGRTNDWGAISCPVPVNNWRFIFSAQTYF